MFFIGSGKGDRDGFSKRGVISIFLQIGWAEPVFFSVGGRIALFSARIKTFHVASVKVDSFICQQTRPVFD